jgi:hypothetical protein
VNDGEQRGEGGGAKAKPWRDACGLNGVVPDGGGGRTGAASLGECSAAAAGDAALAACSSLGVGTAAGTHPASSSSGCARTSFPSEKGGVAASSVLTRACDAHARALCV